MDSSILFGSIGSDLIQMAQDTATRFGVDWQHFIAQCISFGIVAFLLHRYAYKPILAVLEERKKRIKEGLDNAEKIKQELANTQAKTHEIMVQAGQEAAKMIEEARAAAAKVQEQETQKAIAAPRPSWTRPSRRPGPSTPACSPTCAARWAGWWSRRRRR